MPEQGSGNWSPSWKQSRWIEILIQIFSRFFSSLFSRIRITISHGFFTVFFLSMGIVCKKMRENVRPFILISKYSCKADAVSIRQIP
jgi:hypothetical protein